jgi:hypothetical protein
MKLIKMARRASVGGTFERRCDRRQSGFESYSAGSAPNAEYLARCVFGV